MNRKRHDHREERGERNAHPHRVSETACVMCGSSTGLIPRTDFDGFLVCRECLDQIDDDLEGDSFVDPYDDLAFVTRRRTF